MVKKSCGTETTSQKSGTLPSTAAHGQKLSGRNRLFCLSSTLTRIFAAVLNRKQDVDNGPQHCLQSRCGQWITVDNGSQWCLWSRYGQWTTVMPVVKVWTVGRTVLLAVKMWTMDHSEACGQDVDNEPQWCLWSRCGQWAAQCCLQSRCGQWALSLLPSPLPGFCWTVDGARWDLSSSGTRWDLSSSSPPSSLSLLLNRYCQIQFSLKPGWDQAGQEKFVLLLKRWSKRDPLLCWSQRKSKQDMRSLSFHLSTLLKRWSSQVLLSVGGRMGTGHMQVLP